MSSNMHDVVRRLAPGHVVSWTDGSGRYTYVGFIAGNGLVYTTATTENRFIPQTMTLTELANLLDNEGASLFLATQWEVQDAIATSTPPPPVALMPRQFGKNHLFSDKITDELTRETKRQLERSLIEQIYRREKPDDQDL